MTSIPLFRMKFSFNLQTLVPDAIRLDHKGESLIKQNGFSSICLDSEWKDMNGELDLMLKLIENKKPSLLLIDSYYVTQEYLSSLFECVKTSYIDDLNIAIWDTDVLIKDSEKIQIKNLKRDTTYYIRARLTTAKGVTSRWSKTGSFTTRKE